MRPHAPEYAANPVTIAGTIIVTGSYLKHSLRFYITTQLYISPGNTVVHLAITYTQSARSFTVFLLRKNNLAIQHHNPAIAEEVLNQ